MADILARYHGKYLTLLAVILLIYQGKDRLTLLADIQYWSDDKAKIAFSYLQIRIVTNAPGKSY